MNQVEQTYDLSHLEGSMAKWRRSPALRAVYADIFAALGAACGAGPTLEVGSGIGVAREYFPDWVTSDLVYTPFVSRAVSAYEIPAEAWGNIVAFDVFHHLREPMRFLASASDALRPGGRIVLAEPAGTGWGRIFYRVAHPESCRPDAVRAPYRFPPDADGMFANMGMAHAMLTQQRSLVDPLLLELGLRVRSVRYRDVLAYPATGGFSKPAILPAFVIRGLLGVEALLPQALLRLIGLRMVVVLEKAV